MDYITRNDAVEVMNAATWGKSQREAIDEMMRISAADVIPVAWLEEQRKEIDSTGRFSNACALVIEKWRKRLNGKRETEAQDGVPEGDGADRD